MTAYERVEGGRVVERVKTIDGSNEDTRIGCMVMDKQGGWQLEGTPLEPEAPAAQDTSDTTAALAEEHSAPAAVDPAPADEQPVTEPTSTKDTTTKPKRAPRTPSEE